MLRFMTIRTREAGQSDVEAIVVLLHESDMYHAHGAPEYLIDSGEPLRAEDYARRLVTEENGVVLLAEDGDTIVGLVQLAFFQRREAPVMRSRPFAHVGDIVVSSSHRRAGVGGHLMAAAEAWARKRGAADLELGVWEFNEGAIAFYERLGFRTHRRTMMKQLD